MNDSMRFPLQVPLRSLLSVVCVVLLTACSGAGAGLNSFQSPDGRYAFLYPTGWTRVAVTGGPTVVFHDLINSDETVSLVGSDVDAAMLQFKEADAVVKVGERGVARLHNSIAVLTGFIPTDGDPIDLSVDRMKSLPKIPVGVPSKLLIRRPDLKASDRRMQASAIQVGVRKADYLPRIMLVGSGGVASLKTSNLFEGNSGLFSVGPEVDVPLFRLGARKSAVAQAKAEWKESVAMMQSLFLTSVQEVEDALVEAKSLSEELIVRQEAARSASSSANDAHRRYEVGLGAKSEWLAAQVTAKQQGILVQQVRNESVLAQLRLIQALGGIWE